MGSDVYMDHETALEEQHLQRGYFGFEAGYSLQQQRPGHGREGRECRRRIYFQAAESFQVRRWVGGSAKVEQAATRHGRHIVRS